LLILLTLRNIEKVKKIFFKDIKLYIFKGDNNLTRKSRIDHSPELMIELKSKAYIAPDCPFQVKFNYPLPPTKLNVGNLF